MRELGWLVILLGCGADLARPPVARIAIDPPCIEEGDGYRTGVTLDGRGSEDDLVAVPSRLQFEWQWDDPTARVDQGGPHDAVVHLRFAGAVSPMVRLTVRTDDGREASREARVELTAR